MSQNDDNRRCISNNIKQLKVNVNKPVQVCKILTHAGTRLTINDVIFMMVDINGQRQSFLSPISGIITKLNIHELDILSNDSNILEYEECRHTITYKSLCGDCGMDLKQLKSISTTTNSPRSVIWMEPSFPHVTITQDEALKYGCEEHNHFLRKRKLHLLIDLDQTLVHTSNTKNHYPSSPDVIAYQLNTPEPRTFYTKLRPGVKEFLRNLQSLYQFHIVTFGDRPYANTICKLIDPSGTFFSHRILSRDECLSHTDKTANLSSLFPFGDSLVCIIDDREDVWNYAPNLVRVKPYTWFKDVDDLPSPAEISEGKHQRGEKRKSEKECDEFTEMLKKCNVDQTLTKNSLNVVIDTDHYLCQLEITLKRIHKVFYNAYDQWTLNKRGIMPDLKKIIPNIRRQVLKSVSLCFSYLMPPNYPMEKHHAMIIAKAMGAKVTDDLQLNLNDTIQTTHVIAGNYTMKVHLALQNNIKVVTPEWLIDCYEQWEKKAEENYILTPEYDVQKSRLFMEEIPRVSKQLYFDMQQQVHIAQQKTAKRKRSLSNNISSEDSFDMEKEVNDLFIEDDDHCNDTRPQLSKRQCTGTTAEIVNKIEDVNHDSDSDSDSSGIYKLHGLALGKNDGYSSDEESLGDDDVPRGWKKIQSQQRQHS
jgi:RNA polymerase II subunit A-like phosphatase